MMYSKRPIQSSGAEQWRQRHPETGSSRPSWPKASHIAEPGGECTGTESEHGKEKYFRARGQGLWGSTQTYIGARGSLSADPFSYPTRNQWSCTDFPIHTVDYDPFIKSKLASRNQL
jgi:hypothetical protein